MANEGFQIARYAGAPVRVTPGFLVLLGALYLATGAAPAGLLGLLLWPVMIAGSVLAHELGHATVAHANHRRVREIALTWHGGRVTHEGLALPPVLLRVALAGPAASLGLAAACFALSWLPLGVFSAALWTMFWLNLGWGLFNLLPIQPLDGGHALAALRGKVPR